jgi:hypothetical protein
MLNNFVEPAHAVDGTLISYGRSEAVQAET